MEIVLLDGKGNKLPMFSRVVGVRADTIKITSDDLIKLIESESISTDSKIMYMESLLRAAKSVVYIGDRGP